MPICATHNVPACATAATPFPSPRPVLCLRTCRWDRRTARRDIDVFVPRELKGCNFAPHYFAYIFTRHYSRHLYLNHLAAKALIALRC